MNKPPQIREVFVGIDVAFAKKKRLPICVCEVRDKKLTPLPLRKDFDKPPAGFGNKAALQAATRNEFATAVDNWLKKLQTEMGVSVSRVAIDAPSNYCETSLHRRLSDQSLDKAGISCFATPTKKQFDDKIRAALSHLQGGGKEAEMPNANQIWMLVGFALFETLKKQGYDCIETYPQAIVHELKCSDKHKSTAEGFNAQVGSAAKVAGYSSPDDFQKVLETMGFGSRHDKLDAFLSAWVASLPPSQEKVFGSKPNDAIVVPNMAAIEKASMKSGASK
jgi:predicted nuclease with RNAse H fold